MEETETIFAFTVTVQVAFTLPSALLAVTVAEPSFFAEILPEASTVKTVVSLLSKVTVLSLACSGRTVACRAAVCPSSKVREVLSRVMESTSTGSSLEGEGEGWFEGDGSSFEGEGEGDSEGSPEGGLCPSSPAEGGVEDEGCSIDTEEPLSDFSAVLFKGSALHPLAAGKRRDRIRRKIRAFFFMRILP